MFKIAKKKIGCFKGIVSLKHWKSSFQGPKFQNFPGEHAHRPPLGWSTSGRRLSKPP